jgi:hypothetical protein
MRRLFRSAATVALAAVASGSLVAGLTGTAEAATVPPWEVAQPPATTPAVAPNEVGGLTFYNSSGAVITGGNISDNPIAAYIQGNTALQTAPTLADLDGYTPTQNGVPVTSPGNWNGFSFGSSNLPSAAPGALGSSSLPVYTGQSYSLSQLTTAFPNTDTSTTDGYAGLYVLRLRTFQSGHGTTATYDSADISVNSSNGTWSLVYSPQAATATVLAVNPTSPQLSGSSVTLTATVTDPSAPGTVQFLNGTNDVGSPVTVTNGTAQLVTTALPVGNPDNLSAVFTPTTGAAFAGSTSNTVPYVITAPPSDATATALAVNPASAPADTSVGLTANVTDSTAGGTELNGGGSVTFYDNGTATSGDITGSSASLGTVPVGTTGTATLNYSLFAQGAHNVVALFTPSGNYGSSTSGNVLFTATAPTYAPDPQNLQAEIPAGTLTITTPYGPSNPLDLGPATLNPNSGEFTATAPFGSTANGGVTITDTGIGNADWTASAQVTNFSGPGGAVINGQNLTFTHVEPTYITGNTYQASGTGTIPVVTTDVTNNPPGGVPYGPLATGTDGLYGAAHPFASTASPGGGEVNIFGTLTLNAPTSTPSGTYVATLTFTIS